MVPTSPVPVEQFDRMLAAIRRVPVFPQRPAAMHLLSAMPIYAVSDPDADTLFPFAVLDVETTGLLPQEDEIIEVSAIRYDHTFTPTSCFTSLCRPHRPIPEVTRALTGIDDGMVRDCPTFSELAASLSDYLSGCALVGHNLLSFDLRFLYRFGVRWAEDVRLFDTLKIARAKLTSPQRRRGADLLAAYDVENYKLTTLCDYYGIVRNDAHRSLSDCLATGLLLERLVQKV